MTLLLGAFILTLTQSIIQGIIQGLTEFLPVSSSGHLSVFQYFTGINGESGALFSIILHLGTLIAVIAAFWGDIWELIVEFFAMMGDIFARRFSLKKANPRRRMILLLLVSLLPLFAVVGFKDIMEAPSRDNSIVLEGVCFLITSAMLFLGDSVYQGHIKADRMSFRAAAAIGVVQAIAPLPGISRSGSTLSTGLVLGLDKAFAVSFSFIMGIPAVCGALLLESVDIIGGNFDIPLPQVIAGLVCSIVFGLLAIKMVRWLVASNKLRWFGIYMLIIGVITVGIGVYDTFNAHAIQNFTMSLFG